MIVRLDSIVSCDTKFKLVGGGNYLLHRNAVEEEDGRIQVSGDQVPYCWLDASTMVEIVDTPGLQVEGHDKPYLDVSRTASGIKIRVDFASRLDGWVEVCLSEDYIKQLLEK